MFGLTSAFGLLVAQADVTGTVVIKGSPRSQDESFYAKANGCGESPVRSTENWKVGPKGELGDVVIWIVDPKFTGTPSDHPLTPPPLKQMGCRYEPHIEVLRTGDTLSIVNGDPTLHNVRAKVYLGPGKPKGDDVFNFGQSYQGQKDDRKFDQAGILTVQCDVHTWMQSWIMVLPGVAGAPGSAADVSAKDGTFKLAAGNLLQDGDYTIKAWHPRFKDTLEQIVHVKGGTATVSFEFDGAKSF